MEGFNPDGIRAAAAEAQNAPTRFNATERSAMIRTHVAQIRRLKAQGKTREDLALLFPDFCENYKSLFEMLTRPEGYDDRALTMMITMLDKMGSGNLSQHEASVKVGEQLLQKFVMPQVRGSGQ
jgi:hypothetical protein